MYDVLIHLLGLKRPFGSSEEGSVIPYLIKKIDAPSWVDGAGNLHVDLRAKRDSRTLFVAHIDTVHYRGGRNEYRIAPVSGNIHAVGDALGADDAAGVAILMNLIANEVPGYYVFTRGEEVGCVGSQYLADYQTELLSQFDRAIAFDRMGTTDVIDYQRGGQCCSNLFAEALSDALNEQGLLYMPARGVYTDTAEFVDFIPECTNISCGYYGEHSDEEYLDIGHWKALCDATLAIDWEALPTSRQLFDPDSDLLGHDDWLAVGKDRDRIADEEFREWIHRQNMTDDGKAPFDPFVDDDNGSLTH